MTGSDLLLLDETMLRLMPETAAFLMEMINIPSTRGKEGPVNRLIHARMKKYANQAQLMQIPESFKEDPEYSWPIGNNSYMDTQNVRLCIEGSDPDNSRSIIFNAHTDVVPESQGQESPFNARNIDGVIYGRGACDDKGQVAVLYLLIRMIQDLGLKPRGTLYFDFVVEEENGGNGSLFMVRNPVKADAAIVMEPTDMKICPATRGAVWFELTCTGKPAHSGSPGQGKSALKMAIKAMKLLEDYHDQLLENARGSNRLFDQFEDPMPVTFGMMRSGVWPAAAPSQATVKGVFGFLPVYNIKQVQEGLIGILSGSDDPWLANKSKIEFNMLNNEGCEISEKHPMVEILAKSCKTAGKEPELIGLTAACDAWRYNNQLNIPTVVFGAGNLWKFAHTDKEQISTTDIALTAKTLFLFLGDWCGFNKG